MNISEYEYFKEKKRHGEISFPFVTYICTIPLDFQNVPLHWHEEMEIIYIKKGCGVVEVNLSRFEVHAGSIIVVLPGQLHTIYQNASPENELHAKKQIQNGDSCMEYENIIFDPGILISKTADKCTTDYLIPLLDGEIAVPVHFDETEEHYEEIKHVLDCCDRAGEVKPFGGPLYIKAQIFMLLYILENKCRKSEPVLQNMKSLERMKAVIKYVELHYMEHISVEQAAEIAACSASHFMRSFKETFHRSFIDYLKDYRLTIAARLLSQSDANVLAVANEVGFENLSYFTRSFKAKYGLTPGRYAGTCKQTDHM